MIDDTVLNENEFKGCFGGRFEGMVVEGKGQRRKRGIDDLSEIAKCVCKWIRHGCGEMIRLNKGGLGSGKKVEVG